ncbi:TetR/AcrR family transcriptional regulator [Streptomyces sp. CRN 30]|uniref:TetR/AcrR family transcriptional regulator n=1 Tax=Streptomyces sp. CRN 30 TaxID=3075613 RepID=UPI002A8050D2|nr:TetR/AcrR family transcriptional regulator [Streptomyces sp. CRN 30]
MSADGHGSAPVSLRERRRAAAVREIVDAAELHITEHGPFALSLRAVARSLGMTVQALYHYFASRDELVTALIAKNYDDLADGVQAAVDNAADDTQLPRLVHAAEGYRRWAITHPQRFQLLYGTPLPSYAAPEDGSTTRAMRRMSAVFERELFAGYTSSQLSAIATPVLSPQFRARLSQQPPAGSDALPAPAAALMLSAWGHMHGLVVLEAFGHTAFLGEHQAELFRTAMLNMLTEVHSHIPA